MKQYDAQDLTKAAVAHIHGEKMRVISARFPMIPIRTIYDRVKLIKADKLPQKPGPKPILTAEIEDDLVAWVVAMQAQGLPVTRDSILIKGNEIYREMYGSTRSIGFLKRGWLNRFMERHPILSLRSAQMIKRVRNEATEEGLLQFYWEYVKHVVERKLSSDRVFNMDETGFFQTKKSKKVVVVRGSRNVWSKTVESSFHLTIVACCAANEFVVPPLFIVPGVRVNRDVLDSCTVANACITAAPKGFMNSSVFLKWLDHFSSNVPVSVTRPIMLVYDGYSSHYNTDIVLKAIELRIILVLLPANATHLIQPLDVSVFKPLKLSLKREMDEFMVNHAVTSFNKKDSIDITPRSWNSIIVGKSRNIAAGFEASGLWPPSFPKMQRRWKLYHDGGVDSSKTVIAPWIQTREVVRTRILQLPAPIDRTPKRRKTLDCNNLSTCKPTGYEPN